MKAKWKLIIREHYYKIGICRVEYFFSDRDLNERKKELNGTWEVVRL